MQDVGSSKNKWGEEKQREREKTLKYISVSTITVSKELTCHDVDLHVLQRIE